MSIELDYLTLANMAVAIDAATPVPEGGQGSLVWSTTVKQVLKWDGAKWVTDRKPIKSETYASTVTLDCAVNSDFTVTLTGNVTLALTGGSDGQRILVRIIQDGTGSRLLTLDTMVRLGTDVGSVTLSTTASKTDYLGFIVNIPDGKYDVVSFARGY